MSKKDKFVIRLICGIALLLILFFSERQQLIIAIKIISVMFSLGVFFTLGAVITLKKFGIVVKKED